MSGIFLFSRRNYNEKVPFDFYGGFNAACYDRMRSPADSSASDSSSAADSSASAAQTAESSQPVLQESSEAGGSSAAPTAEADDDRTDYEKMVDRSLLSVGDMTRMADVFQKAQNGEDITVAYIGGSITEGYNAEPRSSTQRPAPTCFRATSRISLLQALTQASAELPRCWATFASSATCFPLTRTSFSWSSR